MSCGHTVPRWLGCFLWVFFECCWIRQVRQVGISNAGWWVSAETAFEKCSEVPWNDFPIQFYPILKSCAVSWNQCWLFDKHRASNLKEKTSKNMARTSKNIKEHQRTPFPSMFFLRPGVGLFIKATTNQRTHCFFSPPFYYRKKVKSVLKAMERARLSPPQDEPKKISGADSQIHEVQPAVGSWLFLTQKGFDIDF